MGLSVQKASLYIQLIPLISSQNEVWGKVMFLHLSVILFTFGACIAGVYAVADLGGGTRGACPPSPGHSDSFNFMQFSGKYGKSYFGTPLASCPPPPPTRENPGFTTGMCGGGVRGQENSWWLGFLFSRFSHFNICNYLFHPAESLENTSKCGNVRKYVPKVLTWKSMRKFFLVEVLVCQVARKKYKFYNISGYILSFLLVRRSDLH